jgi:hypothetical protein
MSSLRILGAVACVCMAGAVQAQVQLQDEGVPRSRAAAIAALTQSRPAAMEMSWAPMKTPSGQQMAWLGATYFVAVNDDWGIGPTVYGSARGNFGGIFAGGFTVQRRWRMTPSSHLATSFYVGAGGGVSSDALRFGGGLMLRPEISLRSEFGAWYSGVSLAYTQFPSGNVRGHSVAFVLGRSGRFDSFSASDVGFLGRTGERTGMGFDEISLSAGAYSPRGSSRSRDGRALTQTIGKAGADLRRYISPDAWWGIEASGAAKGGADGYMEILGSMGQDWALGGSGLHLGGQLSAGLGGGGNIDTGNGWLLRAGPTLRWQSPWGVGLRLEGGVVKAPSGHFNASYARLSLSMPLESAVPRDTFGSDWGRTATVRGQTVFASMQHLSRVRFKDNSEASMGQIGMRLVRELSPSVYGTAQAGTAAFGQAGAYAYGLFGAGLGGGALMQSEVWAQWGESNDHLRLRLGLGQWRGLRGGGPSSPIVSVSLGYAFGVLQP